MQSQSVSNDTVEICRTSQPLTCNREGTITEKMAK